MKKVAEEVWTQREIAGDDDGAKEAEKFLQLFDKNFYNRVGCQALKMKADKNAKKKKTIIPDDDIKKLAHGYLDDIELFDQQLNEAPSSQNYYDLSDSLEGYLLVYNR